MINIITLSDKIIINKSKNELSDYISEKLFKNNFRIGSRLVLSSSNNLSSLELKPQEIYIFLAQKNFAVSNKLCETFNLELSDNAYVKQEISNYYKTINEPLDSETIKSWQMPAIARAIVNPNSKFQGYLVDYNNILVFVLPLEFSAATSMFDNSVLPYLLENKPEKYKSNAIKTFGLTESNILDIIKPEIANKYKVSVNIFSEGLCNDIVVKAKESNNNIEQITRQIYQKLEKFVYSVTDLSLTDIFEKALKDKDVKITFIEIISGGCIINSLSNEIKRDNILVSYVTNNSAFICDTFNVTNAQNISKAEETYDIAVNALKLTKSDLVIVTNGEIITNKAETYIALGDRNKIDVYKNNFSGTKVEILKNIKNSTLFYAIKKIKENDFVFFNK